VCVFTCAVWCRDMVAEFEAVSMAMTNPDADLDALTNKMSRLQVSSTRQHLHGTTMARTDTTALPDDRQQCRMDRVSPPALCCCH